MQDFNSSKSNYSRRGNRQTSRRADETIHEHNNHSQDTKNSFEMRKNGAIKTISFDQFEIERNPNNITIESSMNINGKICVKKNCIKLVLLD